MKKTGAILRALRHLEERLGKGAFQIVDHWEGDLLAIGIASPSDRQRLVYIASLGKSDQSYSAILERAPTPGSELPYEDCGKFQDIGLDELTRVVSDHFGNS